MTEPNSLEARKIITLVMALSPGADHEADWVNSFVQQINHLITHDFDRLVSILYRLDVDESKIRRILKNTQPNTSPDAGLLIAKLIIERQLQILKTRDQYRCPDNSIDENERW